MTRNGVLWAIAICAAVVVTNRYTDLEADRGLISEAAGDSYAYVAIAQVAPGLPRERILFHHAQRLAIPYVIGTLHHVVPVSIHTLFETSVIICEIAILLVVAGMLEPLSIRGGEAGVMLAVLALNPWAFRQYVTFPEMVNDLGFVLGLAIVLRGLLTGGVGAVVIGQLIASLSRQTGLMLVPLVVVWIWRDREHWGRHSARARILLCLAVTAIAVGIYAATASIAGSFSEANDNINHLVGLTSWLTSEFDLVTLALFLSLLLAAIAIPLSWFAAVARRPKTRGPASGTVPLLIFASVCCWTQPLLAGPAITGKNAERLASLGLVPLVLALAITVRDKGAGIATSRLRLGAMVALLGAASWHHWYVTPRLAIPGQRSAFVAVYVAACAGVFALAYVRRAGSRFKHSEGC